MLVKSQSCKTQTIFNRTLILLQGDLPLGAIQTLEVLAGTTLTGRNEIRISALGSVNLNAVTLSYVRWLDILPGGLLTNTGSTTAGISKGGCDI